MEDFEQGFVVQTLRNHFILNEIESLIALLQFIGDVDNPIFVTFNKFFDSYESENSVAPNDRAESMDEICKRLLDIDQMSVSEFDNLSDSEKQLYREKIVRVRSKSALNVRAQFLERLSEMRKEKKVRETNFLNRFSIFPKISFNNDFNSKVETT